MISSFFRDMTLRGKLAVVVAILAIPMLALMSVGFRETSSRIGADQKEQDGLTYFREGLYPFFSALLDSRAAAGAALVSGDQAWITESEARDRETAAALAKLEQVDRETGNRFKTAEAVRALRVSWERLQADATNVPEVSIGAHTQIIEEQVFPLVFKVGNASGLFTDTTRRTNNLIVGTSQDFYRLAEAETRTAALGAVLVSRVNQNQNHEVVSAQIRLASGSASAASESLSRWVGAASEDNAAYQEALAGPMEAMRARVYEINARASVLQSNIKLDATNFEAILSEMDGALQRNADFYNAAGNLVAGDVDKRISDARSLQLRSALFGLAGLFGAMLASYLVARSITGPINRLAEAADRMSLGELDVEIPAGGKNEIGRLSEALRRMQLSLRGAIERLRMRRAA